jgi:xanthine/uracil/vitamin C permease (AzgA family)
MTTLFAYQSKSIALQLIPDCMQAATAVGIGLLTALAGASEIGLVVQGDSTVVELGEINSEV